MKLSFLFPRASDTLAQAARSPKKETTGMPYSVSTLLTRNLHDFFGENDRERRRAAINEIFTEDCVFYDPQGGVYRGREEVDRIAGGRPMLKPLR
jgi:hypothetical protein